MNRRKTPKPSIKKPSYREVAARVNRSPMHVWRILNGKGGFSKATEAKVKSVYKELSFKKMPKSGPVGPFSNGKSK